jgi:hypothetical protein
MVLSTLLARSVPCGSDRNPGHLRSHGRVWRRLDQEDPSIDDLDAGLRHHNDHDDSSPSDDDSPNDNHDHRPPDDDDLLPTYHGPDIDVHQPDLCTSVLSQLTDRRVDRARSDR